MFVDAYSSVRGLHERAIINRPTQKQKATVFGSLCCELGGTRTPNLLIRSQVHYPIMLQVRCKIAVQI